VSLIRGVWAEVRTLALGEVNKTGEQAKTIRLSDVSRMSDAQTCEKLVEGETKRRQVLCASQVAGVMDGADWLQGLLDLHRPDALRILDVPHAAQRVSSILETLQHEGTVLPSDARKRLLHVLKHRGSRPVLRWLRHWTRGKRESGTLREDLASLHKREPLMQYPRSQAQGWPIGSGMVESANTLVMQARLKGAGMHWQGDHVTPMLALRSSVCNVGGPKPGSSSLLTPCESGTSSASYAHSGTSNKPPSTYSNKWSLPPLRQTRGPVPWGLGGLGAALTRLVSSPRVVPSACGRGWTASWGGGTTQAGSIQGT